MPLKARRDIICAVCHESILGGEQVTPIEGDGKKLQYTHPYCIAADDTRIPVCKHWKTKGVCIFQVKCQFRHPPELCNSADRLRPRHGTWARHRVYNEGRAAALRRWLIDIFGYEYLRSGSGVLDVAGGKGELSFEMVNLSGIPSCVIDPRPLELNRFRKKLHYGFYHNNEILSVYNKKPIPDSFDEHIIPKHLRLFFEVDIHDSGKPSHSSAENSTLLPKSLYAPEAFHADSHRAMSVAWTNKGLVHEEEVEEDMSVSECCSECEETDRISTMTVETHTTSGIVDSVDNVVLDFEEAVQITHDCSIIVGMHPDQGAEHIVDFALRNNKPFAVVPCCVYHKQFPNRKLSNGEPVRKYGELIEYLMSKDANIHAIEMDFEGKNVLLYHLGYITRSSQDCSTSTMMTVPLRDPELKVDLVCRGPTGPDHWWNLSLTKAHVIAKERNTKKEV